MGINREARVMTFRPMPLLSVLTLISLGILIMLGQWQYDRYATKMANPTLYEAVQESGAIEVEIDGSSTANAQLVYGFADSEPIWRRYVPGIDALTGETVLIMVEATGGPQPVQVAVSDFAGDRSFDGFVTEKSASLSSFGSNDDPENNVWYAFNPTRMAERLGLSGTPAIAEPVIMTVRNADNLSQTRQTFNPYAFAKPMDPLPPERHFGYALTWWGMALGLIGVYVALHRAQGRLKF
jgi:surfeit locus 1 family protein